MPAEPRRWIQPQQSSLDFVEAAGNNRGISQSSLHWREEEVVAVSSETTVRNIDAGGCCCCWWYGRVVGPLNVAALVDAAAVDAACSLADEDVLKKDTAIASAAVAAVDRAIGSHRLFRWC